MTATPAASPAPLTAVGIGPGDTGLLTPEARAALAAASCVAGYGLYLDLLPPELLAGKRLLSSGMRQERERCAAAVDAAVAGAPTALVSSGDAGIYAMAGLALEILEERGLLAAVPFCVVPGVPALCAAAALLGAPLTHDFACISLSDLLTPLERIRARLEAALAADFVCVIYNPRSHGRPDYLGMAFDMARALREPACPVGMVRKAYRPGQEVRLTTLAEADPTWADMLTLVIIGNSESRLAGPYMLTPRGYGRKPVKTA
ncbi:MAG: precorrin-3B C(17)-methyltransferase [Desulfovibrio sp.]|uniref:precorrin-3B C(17)-methyltransferase n=1 Tax=Desulfovibrio sp. TaxID=885 RepID=UPI001A6CCEB4|nr:precorrin-3B C(17)-methyltransferase [Desulfovibrio sp.]MBD5417460.1 precorrin-3B C(17)-methyltransferase [Desulfovibrio sp.]